MAMRLSGLMSGMDTESIVNQIVEARKMKVTKAVKAQKSLGFKQEVWKSLNSQILKLYDGALSNMRFESSFIRKTTKVSNSSVASVITGAGAMNSVQDLEVKQMAKSGYLSGGKMELVKGAESEKITGDTKLREVGFDLALPNTGTIKVKVNGEEKSFTVNRATTMNDFVSELRKAGVNANLDTNNGRIYVSASATGTENDFEILGGDVNGWKALNSLGLNDVEHTPQAIAAERKSAIESLKKLAAEPNSKLKDKLKAAGIDLDSDAWNFDVDLEGLSEEDKAKKLKEMEEKLNAALTEENISAIQKAVNEEIVSLPANSAERANLVQWSENFKEVEEIKAAYDQVKDTPGVKTAKKLDAADAVITLNGMEYTSSKNSFEINGLTITATSEGKTTITTEDDTDGIYDMIKNFFKEYNALINQMDKLYNAASASEYEPLTDEEKEAMSDSAVEQWETKIKDSVLRKDSTLSTIASAMKQIMAQGVEVNGKTMYLSNFGIETLSYFTAAENEKNAYHIDGDSDDVSTAGNADKLKSMIASDPDTVVAFFTGLSKTLHGKMTELMAPTEYSSAFTAYEDKKMQEDYDDYKSKIKDLEKKLAEYEDQWYAKFAAMETAMAKMQSNASAVTALLGG